MDTLKSIVIANQSEDPMVLCVSPDSLIPTQLDCNPNCGPLGNCNPDCDPHD